MKKSGKLIRFVVLALVATLSLSGCVAEEDQAIRMGTTEAFASLDPAGSSSSFNQQLLLQLYAPIFNTKPGDPRLRRELAAVANYEGESVYAVELKQDLKFANGNALEASDVVFSFNRIRTIASPDGPASLLSNIISVEARGTHVVEYRLKVPFDRSIRQLLSSVASVVVDEEVFPANALLSNQEILELQPFSGQYLVDSLEENLFVSFVPNSEYDGALARAKNKAVLLRYFPDNQALTSEALEGKLDLVIGDKNFDLETRELLLQSGLQMKFGAGVQSNYLSLHLGNLPFGENSSSPDTAKAIAVRQALAHLVDRESLARLAYFETASAASSVVPKGVIGSSDFMTGLYGDYSGGPNPARALDLLLGAGIQTPVPIEITYSSQRFGSNVKEQMTILAQQFSDDGFFAVELRDLDASAFDSALANGQLALWPMTISPAFSDVDTYLSPLYRSDLNTASGAFTSVSLDELLLSQLAEKVPLTRLEILGDIQLILATELPAIPLLETGWIAWASPLLERVDDSLDSSYKLRFGSLSK